MKKHDDVVTHLNEFIERKKKERKKKVNGVPLAETISMLIMWAAGIFLLTALMVTK